MAAFLISLSERDFVASRPGWANLNVNQQILFDVKINFKSQVMHAKL